MVKANIIAHSSILEDTVDALASAEIMQVDPVDDNLSEDLRGYLGTLTTPSRHTALLEIELRMERLMDIFSTHFPSQTSMLADLFPSTAKKVKVGKLSFGELKARSESLMGNIEKSILAKNDRLSEINDELARNREKKAQISLLEPLDIPLDYLDDGKYTFTRIGTADDISELDRILMNIPEATFDHVPTGLPEAPNVVVITGMKEVKEDVSKALRGKIFNELQLPELTGRPKEILSELNKTIEKLEKEREKLLDDLLKLKDEWTPKIDVEMELVRIKREKYETYARLGKTKDTVVISGWVEVEKKDELSKHLRPLKYIEISYAEPDTEKDTVPSSLSHSRFIRPFESLVNTFSPPKYNDLDPTPFVAVFFVLFFGMMLGDAGYGLMILIPSIWIGRKVKEGFAASFALIGKCIAAVTIIMGLVTGSFFGDLVQRLIYMDVTRTLYPEFYIGVIKFPYDPLVDPLPLFLIGLGLGVITIYLSVILSTITHTLQKDFKTLLLTDTPLVIMIPSLIILVLQMLEIATIPSIIQTICLGGIALSFILFLCRDYKMPLLAVFEFTGFIGDLLSFARILALGLATVGLAMTWNIVGEMFHPAGSTVIWWILKMLILLVILVFFHLFNFAFQTLGAGIHALRLQYIELFNRCYVGGGVLFSPLTEHRVHTEAFGRKYTKE